MYMEQTWQFMKEFFLSFLFGAELIRGCCILFMQPLCSECPQGRSTVFWEDIVSCGASPLVLWRQFSRAESITQVTFSKGIYLFEYPNTNLAFSCILWQIQLYSFARISLFSSSWICATTKLNWEVLFLVAKMHLSMRTTWTYSRVLLMWWMRLHFPVMCMQPDAFFKFSNAWFVVPLAIGLHTEAYFRSWWV